jgi:uncharacterized protein (AIM24 family)
VLQHQVVGNAMQMIVCTLRPGQVLYAEAGKFLFRSGDVSMETKLQQPLSQKGQASGAKGLLQGALEAGKRMLAGESFAFQQFQTQGGDGMVALAGVLPGEMRAIDLAPGDVWMAEKDAFIGAEGTIRFDIAFSGLRNGLAGGEGFVLEKFSTELGGTLFLGGAGNFIDINPAEYGGKLYVDTGCIVAFEGDKIRYGVQAIGGFNKAGLMSAMFGKEGLTVATLEGDGRVILQSMTIGALATALQKNAGHGRSEDGPTAGLGGLGLGSGLGSLLGGSRD